MPMTLSQLRKRLRRFASPEKAKKLQGFFKTGPGEYGEGDIFIGVTVPETRSLIKDGRGLSLAAVRTLLHSRIHEERFLALQLLVDRYQRETPAGQKEIFLLYCSHTAFINNWDLVDLSAPNIVGAYLYTRSRKRLYTFARSRDLWKRRIAVLATFYFIREKDFADNLAIAALLLNDHEDLIHKAAGWMLREVGKRDLNAEEAFLQKYYRRMPRTMLRYAIERFPEKRRKAYLKGRV